MQVSELFLATTFNIYEVHVTKLAELKKQAEAMLADIGIVRFDLIEDDGVPVLDLHFGMGTKVSITEFNPGVHRRFDSAGARGVKDTLVLTQVVPGIKTLPHYECDLSGALLKIEELAALMPIHMRG